MLAQLNHLDCLMAYIVALCAWAGVLMAWSYTDWQGQAITASLVGEIVSAINERATVLGVAGVDAGEPDAGDQLTAAYWQTLQQWVEDNYTSFIQSHDTSGNLLADGYYDDTSGGPAYWPDWETLCHAAGAWVDASNYGFRQCDTTPGTVSGYGQATAGHILGNWIPRDLQLILNRLIWTVAPSPSFTANAESNERKYLSSDNESDGWLAAKNSAELGYDGASATNYEAAPCAEASGEGPWINTAPDPDVTWFNAGLYRNYAYATVTPPGSASVDIEFYLKAVVATGARSVAQGVSNSWTANSFDGCGDFDGYEDKYKYIGEVAGTGGSAVTSGKIGTNDAAAYPVWPTEPNNEAIGKGYEMDGTTPIIALAKWTFTYM